jgi:cytochrome c oxidase subunit 2
MTPLRNELPIVELVGRYAKVRESLKRGTPEDAVHATGQRGVSIFMKWLNIAAAFLICGVFIQGVPTATAQEAVRTIEIHAKRFSFTPAEITLKKGETVKLVITSDDVTHALVIPALHVKATVKKDQPAEVTLTADQVGDFDGKCGHYCGSGHGTMKFVVHVTNSE